MSVLLNRAFLKTLWWLYDYMQIYIHHIYKYIVYNGVYMCVYNYIYAYKLSWLTRYSAFSKVGDRSSLRILNTVQKEKITFRLWLFPLPTSISIFNNLTILFRLSGTCPSCQKFSTWGYSSLKAGCLKGLTHHSCWVFVSCHFQCAVSKI